MRDIDERLRDIQEAITKIMKYASRDMRYLIRTNSFKPGLFIIWRLLGKHHEQFHKSSEINIQDIEWKQISGMRNALIHGYFEINTHRVWDTITFDLPA